MIHVYALVDAAGSTGAVDPVHGIDDRPVEFRVTGAVAAVLSRHDAPPEPTAEALLRHAAVVEAVQERDRERAVLPARFGSGAADDRAVDDLLSAPGLADRLDRVRGCVEVDVRLVAAAAPPTVDAPAGGRTGRDHLASLAARHGRADGPAGTAVQAVRERLEVLGRAEVERPLGSARVLRHTALLLDRTTLPDFRRAVAGLAVELAPAHTVVCTGPWPPYNFVDPARAPGGERSHEVAR